MNFLLCLVLTLSAFGFGSTIPNTKLLIESLSQVLDFVEKHYYQINFDGLLGVVIAESQLLQISPREDVADLIFKCERIKRKIQPLLPNFPRKYVTFAQYLLNPQAWKNNVTFVKNRLEDLGVYSKTTTRIILNNNVAIYKGTPTDFCVSEILERNCKISPFCREMMLANRTDTGYLLTHRLLYLQIARLKRCPMNNQDLQKHLVRYCSLMLKEARSNEILGFPQHDILLEQILFCGSEGFEEFLTDNFRKLVVDWKNRQGCYYPDSASISKRSANRIDFGCTDHATGLGVAALALSLRYLSEKEKS